MQRDLHFHALLLCVLLALGAIRVWYWRQQRAALGFAFAQRQGTLNDLRQIGALVGFLLVGVHVVNPSLLGWTEFPLPGAIRWVGGAIAVLTTAASWVAGRAEIVALRRITEGAFTARGLFAWVRHPLEIVIVSLAVGLTLLSANWVVALLSAAFAAHALFVRAPRVDRERRARLGAAYEEYARVTPAFLPRRRPWMLPL